MIHEQVAPVYVCELGRLNTDRIVLQSKKHKKQNRQEGLNDSSLLKAFNGEAELKNTLYDAHWKANHNLGHLLRQAARQRTQAFNSERREPIWAL